MLVNVICVRSDVHNKIFILSGKLLLILMIL